MKQAVLILLMLSTSLTACTEKNVRESPDDKISNINLELGVAYMQDEKYSEAMKNLDKARQYNPDDPRVHGALALLYDRLGEHDQAESAYREAVRLDESNSLIRNNFGAFLCAQERYSEAYEQYQAAVKNPLYRTPEYAYTNAGMCALRSKDAKKAEGEFRAALRKNPKFPIALFQMATLSYQNGKALSARGYLQRYAEVAQPGPESLWLSIQVEKALGDRDAVASQSLLLKARFPDAEETQKLLEMEAHE